MASSKLNRNGKSYKVYVPTKEEELSDELNPQFLFQTIHTSLLVDILSGKINPVEGARRELQNRGLDERGKWVGFNASNK